MKRETSISSLFGLNQQEMAQLLRVSRSQYSMFELGKRSLPPPAMQLLAEMLAFVNKTESDKSLPVVALQAQQFQLESLLRENELQQLVVAKKIADLHKKQQARAGLSKLVAFLNHRDAGKESETGLLKVMAFKASAARHIKSDAALLKHEHQLQVLALEKDLLETQLQKKTYGC